MVQLLAHMVGMGTALEQFSDAGRQIAADAWLEASSYALNAEGRFP